MLAVYLPSRLWFPSLHAELLALLLSLFRKKGMPDRERATFTRVQELVQQMMGGEQQLSELILDSGCGTGRSTLLLARQHPHALVVGVDKSGTRLSKFQDTGAPACSEEEDAEVALCHSSSQTEDDSDSDEVEVIVSEEEGDSVRLLPQQPNAMLVQADLVSWLHTMYTGRIWDP